MRSVLIYVVFISAERRAPAGCPTKQQSAEDEPHTGVQLECRVRQIMNETISIEIVPAGERVTARSEGSNVEPCPPKDPSHDQTVAALRLAESELRLVSAALLSSQEMERKRIACELHDSIGQVLNSIAFGSGVALEMVRAKDIHNAEEMLVRLSAQAKQAVGDVRRIAMDLRPAMLDHLGIVGTLSWFLREFRSIHPDLKVTVDIDVRESDVSPNLVTTLYRVVQEACSNVVRHAGASEVRVLLNRFRDSLELRIEDNGRGIEGGERQGMGLRSMRDRVQFSGGSFRLESEVGKGTSIVAAWRAHGSFCKVLESADAIFREPLGTA
jgi:signal transduction histidine kinase